MIKSDSARISEPSTDIVAFIRLNDKHSHKINLNYSTKQRVRFKNSLFFGDFIQIKFYKTIFKTLNVDKQQYIQEIIISLVTLCECRCSDSSWEIRSSRIIDARNWTTAFHLNMLTSWSFVIPLQKLVETLLRWSFWIKFHFSLFCQLAWYATKCEH